MTVLSISSNVEQPITPPLTIALAGQPNVGKSSVFNALTGLNQYVSNWPGKTCEQKVGNHNYNGGSIHIIDLPGTYSLTANSVEERIARDAIIKDRPSAVVAIVDAASLERNLYLVAELLSLSVPIVIGLNRIDVAASQGVQIETHVLEAALGIPVVSLAANKGQGVSELMEAVHRVVRQPETYQPNRPTIREDHLHVLHHICELIIHDVPDLYSNEWVALKLLEGDSEITQMMREQMGSDWEKVEAVLAQHDDAFLAVVSGRYEWIGRMVRAAVLRPKAGQVTVTDRIDRLANHPVFGLILLLSVLGVLFWLTYAIGAPLQSWLEIQVVQTGAEWVRALMQGGPAWLSSMVADGVIAGAGTVLTLLPILLIFFVVLGFLEDMGYMARAAFVMDRFMHVMGLHGKSFLPMFLGFGCNVPAIMGSRIIESKKARLITILITPLVPCTARMSVIAFLAPIFYGANALWVSWGLVFLSLAALTLLGVALHKWLLGGEQNAFIMELPLYQVPNLHEIGLGVWQRLVDFLKTAGTIILVVSLIMWALSTFPSGDIESSYLASFGRLFAPLGQLMGLDWQMMVALLTSFVRKENTIPTLAVLYGAGQEGGHLAGILGSHLNPAAALAFLAVQVLFIPCVATVATIRQETGSWLWTSLNILMLLVISLGAGILIYQGALLMGWGL